MPQIIKKHITSGVTWIEIKEADLFLCCGCPADVIKHLKKAGIVKPGTINNAYFENGPNAILLSDTLIQNGKLANLTEFVILHMLYLQGLLIPGHPNYQKYKPLLIGYQKQIQMQNDYVSVGNHGLEEIEQIVETGIKREGAEKIYATKLHYAGGEMKRMEKLLDNCILNDQLAELRNGVSIERTGLNKFNIYYKDEVEAIDLNLDTHEQYHAPYDLPFRQVKPARFSITHSGEGNGWDIHRPCMASIIHHEGQIYLIDAGPNILSNLAHLGIGLSEIDGIFLSHIHDDHFAGITDLLNVEKKLNLYATPLIKETAKKKLNALFNSEIDLLNIAFRCIDLQFDEWNDINGLEVMPSYSPHTVETSIFKFRVRFNDQYKSYLHLADTINFSEFDVITEKWPEIFTEKDREYVRNSYLDKVSLKKLDVGGGSIHGHLSDYLNDESDKLVMAHTTNELAPTNDRFVNAQFGDTDHLVNDKDFDFIRTKSKQYLNVYFNTLSSDKIEELVNGKLVIYPPGKEILGTSSKENIFLVVSGLVKFKNEIGVEQRVDGGNFIGYAKKYFSENYNHQYFSLSYVVCLQFEEPYIDQVFYENKLFDDFRTRVNLTSVLRESYLVQYSLSSATYFELARESKIVEVPDTQFSDQDLEENIYILIEGSVTVQFEDKYFVKIHQKQHFGGMNLLTKYRRKQKVIFSNKIKAVSVPIQKLMKVPVLLWKLIELEEIRYQLSIFETE